MSRKLTDADREFVACCVDEIMDGETFSICSDNPEIVEAIQEEVARREMQRPRRSPRSARRRG